MENKVSILMPVYNTSKYLSKCINSLIKQTYKDIEIIAVNDGSTDNSRSILEKFAEKDSRITVVNKENEGLSLARETALEHATGDCIMFVDSDDYLDRNAVQECMQSMNSNHSDLVVFGMNKFLGPIKHGVACTDYGNLTNEQFMKNHYISFFGISDFPVNICGKLYKKELFENVTFSKIFMGEDLCVNIQIMPNVKKISFVNKALYYYRFGGGSSKFSPNFLKDYQVIKNYQYQMIEKYGLDNEYEEALSIESANVFRTFIKSYLFDKKDFQISQADMDFAQNAYRNTDFIQRAVHFLIPAVPLKKLNGYITNNINELIDFNAEKYCRETMDLVKAEKSSSAYRIKKILSFLP